MESATEKSFYEHLLALGFPSSAIIYEPAFKLTADERRFRPDFAVLDPTSREVLAIDGFFVVCYCTAAGALLVAIADFVLKQRGVTVLTAERLTLLAVAAALVIVPYLQKFKALGVEIERQGGETNG